MNRPLLTIASALIVLLGPAPLRAQEYAIGIGLLAFDLEDGGLTIASLDYRDKPFYRSSKWSLAFAANVSSTDDRDFYIGAGISLRSVAESGWFLEASTMPGYYSPGSENNDLGLDLEFRTLLAVGYHFENGQRASLALTHKSNADIGDSNPGADALLLRWHRRF